jgi:membrane-associated phospholipid phosphatase
VTKPRIAALSARSWPQLSWRAWVFIGVLIAYGLLTWSVLVRSPILTLDSHVLHVGLRFRMAHPTWFHPLNVYAMFGQRAPTAVCALPWVIWQAYRRRSAYPIIMLLTALFVLNLSVGIVKIYIGRLGPIKTYNTYKIFSGGDIYPSGHVSNTVVMFGVIAMIAVGHKKILTALAVFMSVSVGVVTIYLKTHWLSDVEGGWLSGSLVLLMLPHIVPRIEVLGHHAIGRWLHLEPPERVVLKPARESLVSSGSGRSDELRVPAKLTDPVRPVVATRSDLGRRGRVETR